MRVTKSALIDGTMFVVNWSCIPDIAQTLIVMNSGAICALTVGIGREGTGRTSRLLIGSC